MPTHNLNWLPTRQPVVTDLWKTSRAPSRAAVFTSVANWSTSGLKDITWRGEKYLWSKSREFLRFVAAPKKAGETFELATNIKDAKTRAKFLHNGWRFHSPLQLSVDYWLYRDYVRRSKGEFTVAKDQYVRLNTGWFSDRSACYLAAGRPVIIQETGFTKNYGGDAGLLTFKSLGEIVDAVKAINADYKRHARAARTIAHEIFEAGKFWRRCSTALADNCSGQPAFRSDWRNHLLSPKFVSSSRTLRDETLLLVDLAGGVCLSQVHAQQEPPPATTPAFPPPPPSQLPAQAKPSATAVPLSPCQCRRRVQTALFKKVWFGLLQPKWNPIIARRGTRARLQRGVGAGFVIEGNRIMTNAHVVSNSRYLTVERDGDPNKYPAKVLFVAHDCDLALITVDAPNFYKNMLPLKFGGIPELESTVSAYGYPIGGERMSVTTGIVSRIDFQLYTHSSIDQHLAIQISAQINPGNSGGPVMQNAKVVGVAFQGYSGDVAQGVAYMVPTPVIRRFLKDIEDGHYNGYVDLAITYSKLQNPAQRKFLGLKDDDRGVLVTTVVAAGPCAKVLRQGDVLLAMDDHPIASDANVELEGERVEMPKWWSENSRATR